MIECMRNRRGIGIGAGALDLFRPRGEVGDDHLAGEKPGWAPTDDQLLIELLDNPCVERHTGGNIVNVLAFLACQKALKELAFLGALGDKQNPASQAIAETLESFGILNLTKRTPGYQPSVSIIETKDEPGSDRMVRGRPRDDMILENELLEAAVHGRELIIVSSLKKAELFNRILTLAPEDALLSYNPGSTELYADPMALRSGLQKRKAYLLVLNNKELRVLMQDYDTDLHQLALRANELASFVLCTRGKDGMFLVNNADIVEGKPVELDQNLVVDTLGAGDRAHAAALYELLHGSSPETTLASVAHETAEVIQYIGGHGDLSRKIGSVAVHS